MRLTGTGGVGLIAWAFLILLVDGCHTVRLPADGVTFSQVADKLNLRVELHIPDELRNAEWHSAARTEGDPAAIGENIAINSQKLVRNVFAYSVVSEKGNSGGNKDTTHILTPRLIFSRYVHGGSAWDEARFTVCLEWRLVAADGKLKWVDTIKGIGKGSGFLKTTKLDNSMKLAIQDTFDKSQSAMLASRVLRELTQAP